MKKIVGIIAAVAMAASVFAVDFSGALIAEGSLFNLSFKEDSKPTALTVGISNGGMYYNSRFQTAIYADKAGAQFAVAPNGGQNWDYSKDPKVPNGASIWSGTKLWVSPIDMLTISVLDVNYNLNQPWTGAGDSINFTGYGACAWQFELKPIDGLSINLLLGNTWINNDGKDKDTGKAKNKIGKTALFAKYGADFGTIGFGMIYSPSAKETVTFLGEKQEVAYEKGLVLSAGYSNKFGDIDMFADVALNLTTDSDTADAIDTSLIFVKADAQVAYAKDALSAKAYAQYSMLNPVLKEWNKLTSAQKDWIKDNTNYKAFCDINDLWLEAEISYALDACTPYLFVKTSDILVQKLDDEYFGQIDLQIKPGIKFNIGAAACEVAVDFSLPLGKETTADEKGNFPNRKGKVSVPFNVTVGF